MPYNQLNNYFVNVEETLGDKLPASDINPLVYIYRSSLNSFVFHGICEFEVYDKIMKLKVRNRRLTFPVNVLKSLCHLQ